MTNMLLYIKLIASTILGVVVYWLGGLDELLTALIVLVIIDYLSGVAKAIHNKELSSSIGLKGIVKKVLIFAIVAVSFVVETVINFSIPLREVVITFFLANEGISILENASQTGIPIPQKLVDILAQLHNNNKNEKK